MADPILPAKLSSSDSVRVPAALAAFPADRPEPRFPPAACTGRTSILSSPAIPVLLSERLCQRIVSLLNLLQNLDGQFWSLCRLPQSFEQRFRAHQPLGEAIWCMRPGTTEQQVGVRSL